MIRIILLAAALAVLLSSACHAQAFRPGRIMYLSPLPSSMRVSLENPVLVRFDGFEIRSLTNLGDFIRARGSASGLISGETRLASDGRTIIFSPDEPFQPGEEIRVRLRPEVGGVMILDSTFTFRTALNLPVPGSSPDFRSLREGQFDLADPLTGRIGDPVVINGVSIPSGFPMLEVRSSDNPSPGYFFLNNWGGTPYNMIVDNSGAPVWYWRTPDRRRDFKLQPNGWLTMLIRQGYGGATWGHIALDSTYSVVDTMRAAAGYTTDEHELIMLEDGHYFLIGRMDMPVDMSQLVVGGQPNATVRETVVQEFTPEGDLIFLWRSWDHFDIRDLELDNLRGSYIRFPHINAVSIDDDGHVVISSRHLSEVTKINRETGEIIWRLGGRHNEFTWIDDPLAGISSQHDVRALGGGRYTIFDNGNGHLIPESRAVEYEIDAVEMTATLVWQYRHKPRWFTPWMGNAQRLPSGGTLINYADAAFPKIVEVRPDGSTALEMDFAAPANCYRVFKFDWLGRATRPYLLAESSNSRVTLIFNQFGDPDVAYYNIYGGTESAPVELLATSTQPFAHLTDLQNLAIYHFRVTAVSSTGRESEYSNEVTAYVNFVERGENMIVNGDFSRGTLFWDFGTEGGAQASATTTADKELHFQIENGGSNWYDIQLLQPGMALIAGRRYRFEFEAHADENRIFEAKITRDGEPWTNYGKIGLTALTRSKTHYAYDFVMEDPSDFAARIVLNAGRSEVDVYVDDVVLKELVPTASHNERPPAAGMTILHPNYPNPFFNQTTLVYSLPEAAHVTLRVYDVLGRLVDVPVDAPRQQGVHSETFTADGLPAGMYGFRIEVAGATSSVAETRLMLLVNK